MRSKLTYAGKDLRFSHMSLLCDGLYFKTGMYTIIVLYTMYQKITNQTDVIRSVLITMMRQISETSLTVSFITAQSTEIARTSQVAIPTSSRCAVHASDDR